jgi:hypothetical protein
MKKQTAVEWLYETIWKEWNFSFSSNVLEQAKEMEKKQIADAVLYGHSEWIESNGADDYYNETFKQD